MNGLVLFCSKCEHSSVCSERIVSLSDLYQGAGIQPGPSSWSVYCLHSCNVQLNVSLMSESVGSVRRLSCSVASVEIISAALIKVSELSLPLLQLCSASQSKSISLYDDLKSAAVLKAMLQTWKTTFST